MTAVLAGALPPVGRNAILEVLQTETRGSLEGQLREVHLEEQAVVSAEEEGVEGLYFPLSCLICRLVSLPQGTTVKVSLAGREGMVGASALVDTSSSSFRTVVQLPGRAVFLPRGEARRLLEFPGAVQLLSMYLLLLLRETSLTAACNRIHTATQRLARWLLLIQDRADRNEFPITHESLSAMLGVRRESVSLSAQQLRNAEAIEYRRARVRITNRSALENESCTCYRAISADYIRFLEIQLGRRPYGDSA
jgi:CRP-like cAMP-binding protein